MADGSWSIQASYESMHCVNPIRQLVDTDRYQPNPEKTVLKLNIGDPTFYGNLPPSPVTVQALADALTSGAHNNYKSVLGDVDARAAVAKKYTYQNNPITEKDVMMTSGCAQAVEFCMTALCDPGSNVLVPTPGFSLYKVNTDSRKVDRRLYNLMPDKQWEADIAHMESLIDDKTRCIVVVNPSNPCGSVYSKAHLQQIIAVAEKHHLPLIADEIYGGVVYNGAVFHPLASLTDSVPILTCAGIGKSYLVPGWRLGWLIFYDKFDRLKEIRRGCALLGGRILGANSVAQGALPKILSEVPQDFFENTNRHLATTSSLVFDKLSQVSCLMPIRPYGAMYILFGVNFEELADIADDGEFTEKLMGEESVFLLPGTIFAYPNYIRIVLLAPVALMSEALDRIVQFCHRHMKSPPPPSVN